MKQTSAYAFSFVVFAIFALAAVPVRAVSQPITVTVIADESARSSMHSDLSMRIQSQAKKVSNRELDTIPLALFNSVIGYNSDGDGLADDFERAIGTDSDNSDSDGDGYVDDDEVIHAYSPLRGNRARYPINKKHARTLAGRFLVSREGRPGVWYVNPYDAKRYLLLSDDDLSKAKLKPSKKNDILAKG
ncbi:hypothetical protein HY627_02510 [Candidatus Uhrbacteria bacterium]|nr:hypothetical protein [Candidatus Uhrbacteria bacterium]